MKLTKDELWDLAELACAHAEYNDEDEEYYNKYKALYEKLLAIIKEYKE